MKQGSFFILFVMLFLSAFAVAQTKTVTGNDLAKFREKRLKAEREYRENYARLGMPSPEELERRRVADIKETEELSNRIRNERLAREAEQLRLYQLQQQMNPAPDPTYIIVTNPNYGGYFIYGRNRFFPRHFGGGPWRAGGGGIVHQPRGRSGHVRDPLWPTRSRTP